MLIIFRNYTIIKLFIRTLSEQFFFLILTKRNAFKNVFVHYIYLVTRLQFPVLII